MAKFHNLIIKDHYDIIDSETGRWKTQGIQGGEAMMFDDWDEGDEAWPAGEEEFKGQPEDIAE